MAEYLKTGDTVNWRGAWGSDPAMPAVVTVIEVNTRGGKEGDPADSVPWEAVTRRNVVVSLDNGHWAYGNAIKPMEAK